MWAWALTLFSIIASILLIYKNYEDIKKFFLWIKNLIEKILIIITGNKWKNYQKRISEEKYRNWEKDILKIIYDENVKKIDNCYYAKAYCNGVYNYDSVYLMIDDKDEYYKYPFKNVYNKRETKYLEENKNNFEKLTFSQRRFFNIQKINIHYPNDLGYMLDEIDNSITKFHLTMKVATYKYNVCTSHILGFELYKLYKKCNKLCYLNDSDKKSFIKSKTLFLGKDARSFLLAQLKNRNAIHKEINNEDRILLSGKGRYSLLGVQAFVLCKNPNGSYDVLMIKRSNKVDAKPGYLQFIPSGGFSSLSHGINFQTQFSDCSITKAVFREMLEECFGEEDFSGKAGNYSSENIYYNSIIQKLISQDLKMFFLGSAISLNSLRHELCFLMIIDNKDVIAQLKQNEESENVIYKVPVKILLEEEYWQRFQKDKGINDCSILNDTSAALWNLVCRSKHFKQIAIENEFDKLLEEYIRKIT